MDEFVSVTHKKLNPKHRKGKKIHKERTLEERRLARQVLFEDSGFLTSVIAILKDAIERLEWTADFEICCLGLGSPSEGSGPIDQLILLQSIIADLKIPIEQVIQCYDPASTELDNEFLTSLNLHPISIPYELELKNRTLLYMLHSPKFLYNDLLRLNWSKEGFSKILMLGNELTWYTDPSKPSYIDKSPSIYLDKAAALFKSIPLPIRVAFPYVFNDTAIQWVPKEVINQQTEEFWNFARENDFSRDKVAVVTIKGVVVKVVEPEWVDIKEGEKDVETLLEKLEI